MPLPPISRPIPAYARAVVRRIISATRGLSRFPNSGRIVPEFQHHTIREVFAHSYRIIYLVSDEVLIVTVIHGKRNLP
jgi:plasmid stabilization system protein ParE